MAGGVRLPGEGDLGAGRQVQGDLLSKVIYSLVLNTCIRNCESMDDPPL